MRHAHVPHVPGSASSEMADARPDDKADGVVEAPPLEDEACRGARIESNMSEHTPMLGSTMNSMKPEG